MIRFLSILVTSLLSVLLLSQSADAGSRTSSCVGLLRALNRTTFTIEPLDSTIRIEGKQMIRLFVEKWQNEARQYSNTPLHTVLKGHNRITNTLWTAFSFALMTGGSRFAFGSYPGLIRISAAFWIIVGAWISADKARLWVTHLDWGKSRRIQKHILGALQSEQEIRHPLTLEASLEESLFKAAASRQGYSSSQKSVQEIDEAVSTPAALFTNFIANARAGGADGYVPIRSTQTKIQVHFRLLHPSMRAREILEIQVVH